MQSAAQDVSTYIAEAPADRQAALTRLRGLCRAHLTGFEESMQYGMPCYTRDGQSEVAFASQKNYISLYITRNDIRDQFAGQIKAKGVSLGKGCIRYAKPEYIDFALVEQILTSLSATRGEICP